MAIPAFCDISAIDVFDTPCVVKSLNAVSKREVLFCCLLLSSFPIQKPHFLKPVSYTHLAYTLAVRKPVITWAQNKGNGNVYLDWVNIEDADSYAVSYREAGSTGDFTYAVKDLAASQADYTVTGLEAGKSYEFKIEATRNSDGFVANAVATVEVKKDADQKWYVATVGSAQKTNAVITAEDGTVTKYDLDSQEQTANKQNNRCV